MSPIAKVRSGTGQTLALPAHEQGHYDIAIAAAWALARDMERLSAAELPALKSQLVGLFTLHRGSRLSAQQKVYDAETLHSQNSANQVIWQAAIAAALKTGASTLQGLPL